MDLFNDDTTCGYHLDFFQLYNWGLFNKNIYTVEAHNKSTLLTGENGSGKTTLVDGLLSLLVPPQIRFYNQSSGSEHKKDRNEESYVLGAFGNTQSGDSLAAKTQYLRTRENAVSILNASFYDASSDSYLTLLQVRYFSGTELQRVFALTKQSLRIEELTSFLKENNAMIDRSGRWKKILSSKFGTVFFDSFNKYSDAFSQIFHLSSDKALKLFNQIVGLKVLGNLTEFIRSNMIDSLDAALEFEKLQNNYTKLLQCDKEIRKTKRQIELLEPVLATGKNWKDAVNEKARLEFLLDAVAPFKAENADKLLKQNIDELKSQLLQVEENLLNKKREIENLSNQIDSIKTSLAQNEISQRIREIDNSVKQLEEDKARVKATAENFEQRVISASLEIPRTEIQFTKLIASVPSLIEKANQTKMQLDENKTQHAVKLQNLGVQKNDTLSELESLGNRNSNIPAENIRIRSKICSALKIAESDLPFAGELIEVKPSESEWNYAIKKLLHNFALDLLVTDENYKRVTQFVKENDVGGRLVYLKTENSALENNFTTPETDTVPGKLNVKQNHALTHWLENYLEEHFNFRCTEDIAIFSRAECAITKSGLIKSGIKHEKDDRKKDGTNARRFIQVLGWDNSQKRRELSSQLDEISAEIETEKSEMQKIISKIKAQETKLSSFGRILEYKFWNQIDFSGITKQIDGLSDERKKLAANKDIKELQMQLDSKQNQKERIETERGELNKKFGSLQNQLEQLQKKFEENKVALDTFNSNEDFKNKSEEGIAKLQKEYPRLTNPKTLEELEHNVQTMQTELRGKSNTATKTINGYETNLVRAMETVRNPSSKDKEEFGDWSAEFMSLNSGHEYLGDYEAFAEKLKKDGLPKYQKQFHEYLHDTVKNDIIDFNQFIINGTEEVEEAVRNLNISLKQISYSKNPDTYLQLVIKRNSDRRIEEFKSQLKAAIPDAVRIQSNDEVYEEQLFLQIKRFLNSLKENQKTHDFVLDIRNWYTFAATENFAEDNEQKQFYNDSASLSGGEKAKLTYTILASAIAYQFGDGNENGTSFRFAIIDEAFSKSDSTNSEYAMKLFKQLNLQTMVVTPLDKINIVEDYISSVHMTENKNTDDSRLLSMTIEKYRAEKENTN